MDYKEKAMQVLNNIEQNRRREDAIKILESVIDIIPDPPIVYEDKSIIFGDYHYVNKTNEGDMCIFGITPAKAHITLYFAVLGLDPYQDLLEKLGKYKRGKICLYITNFDKIDLKVFRELVEKHYLDSLQKKKELGR